MNTNKLLSVLRDIRLLKFVSEDELHQLADDYPYFQQAHILLAKKYLLDSNPHFEEKLHLAAIYDSDRTNLRAIMLGDVEKKEAAATAQPAEAVAVETPLEDELSHASMSDVLPPQDSLLEEENYEAITEENTSTEAEALEELEGISLPSETTQEEELSHASMSDMPPPQDSLPEEENYEAMTEENTSTEAGALEELEATVLPVETAQEKELSHASMSDALPPQDTIIEEENYELVEDNNITEATAMEELEAVVTTEPAHTNGAPLTETFNVNQPHTFADWLKFIQNSPRALLHKSSAPDYHPISVAEPQQPAVEELVYVEHNPDILVAEPADNLQAIDEFVAETTHTSELTRVIPIKEQAEKSVEENDELLTETLARVYEDQQLYGKAIRIYALLSLKFPEKSLYFASLIKELKSKL